MSGKFRETVFQAIGEASMCWSQTPGGVFDSSKAQTVGERILSEHLSVVSELEQRLKVAVEFIESRRCRTYVGIATPGREVTVHDGINCKKCKVLDKIREARGGRIGHE